MVPIAARAAVYVEAAAGGPAGTYYADSSDETVGYSASDSATYIRAYDDNSNDSQGQVYLDCTDLSGETITAATLYFYCEDYTTDASKPPTSDQGNIEIYTGSGWYEFYQFTTYPGDGQRSCSLDATALTHIGAGVPAECPAGDYDTAFRFSVDDPGSGRSRSWDVCAYEGSNQEVYLDVTVS